MNANTVAGGASTWG